MIHSFYKVTNHRGRGEAQVEAFKNIPLWRGNET